MKFGDSVLAIVEACTDADVVPKPPWVARKTQVTDAIAHKSASAVLVAASDKLHNARAILRDFRTHRAALWTRFNKDAGEAGTMGYYRALVTALHGRVSALADQRLGPLVQELAEVVTTLEREVGFPGVWPPVAEIVLIDSEAVGAADRCPGEGDKLPSPNRIVIRAGGQSQHAYDARHLRVFRPATLGAVTGLICDGFR